jgi:ribA/ribD-fused uncharacterized protein
MRATADLRTATIAALPRIDDASEYGMRIMWKAVWTKFNQHPRLAAMLMETGDAEIVEHTENDAYWGDGGDGKGLNRLGQILMQVRAELRVGK